MIPIITSQQIREADKYTIENEPISSIDLMERASVACAEWITNSFSNDFDFIVICGQGNNGGDGLAIARLLSEKNYNVEVLIVKTKPKGSEDFEKNLKNIKKLKITEINNSIDKDILDTKIVIDAIFGTGLNKAVEGDIANIIHSINISESAVISIDIPSGLFSEGENNHVNINNTIFATHTLCFETPKLSLLLSDSGKIAGHLTLLDIGLDNDFICNQKTNYYAIEQSDIADELLPREKFSHKGNFGHTLIIAGSKGKSGACVLSVKACLRTGAGLVTAHIPSDSLNIIQTTIPEAMVSIDENSDIITNCKNIDTYSCIAVGPGIGTSKETSNFLKVLIQNSKIPIIFDADAINILSENKTWLSFLPKNSILTPHLKEFDRLFGKSDNSYNRLQLQQNMSAKYNVYIVLKGAHTSISAPNGSVFFNTTGNPGMATAGSGDVLTGIIAGIYSQYNSSIFACLSGVYIHGLAGDIASSEIGETSLIASDIIENIGKAFKNL